MQSPLKLLALLTLAACAPESHAEPRSSPRVLVDPGAAKPAAVERATAVLHPTKGSSTRGVVHFRQTEKGVEVHAAIDGLPEGRHAYHVHVYGDCSSPDAESAGPHFHFKGSSFDKSVGVITGNLGELTTGGGDAGGRTTTHQSRLPAASLQGRFSIIGRAVIVHANGNDHAHPPDGNAGHRLACGVIGVTSADVRKP